MLEKLFGRQNVQTGDALTADKFAELDVMTAEWDLLKEIQEALRLLSEVRLKYVKGHQDTHQAYTRLPLIAQLNVDADDKAKAFQQLYGKAHPFVVMTPHAGAFVTIPEGTITAKIVTELRNYATGPPLRRYIQEQNHWNDSTMNSINWRAHGKALNGLIAKRVHFTKMVPEGLPTFHRLNRFTNGDRRCPACLAADETRDHIIRCPDTERARWQTSFMAKIEEFHDRENTSPVLRSVWREAMELWFSEERTDVQVPLTLFPTEVRQVIMQQNAIGWRQIFNGRFAISWAIVQDDFFARRAGPSENARTNRQTKRGKQWQHKFIMEIWKQWTALWKTRNDLVHGKTQAARAEALQRAAAIELRSIYDSRAQLEPTVQQLLFREVQDHTQRHQHSTTRNWLHTNAPIFRESLRRAKRRAIAGVRSIRSYFAQYGEIGYWKLEHWTLSY
jgi:hypothetical protein